MAKRILALGLDPKAFDDEDLLQQQSR